MKKAYMIVKAEPEMHLSSLSLMIDAYSQPTAQGDSLEVGKLLFSSAHDAEEFINDCFPEGETWGETWFVVEIEYKATPLKMVRP